MSLSTVNVSLLNAATAKARLVSLPRDMTIAELQRTTSDNNAAFSVDGCTPAASATLGDLYDACASNGALEVTFTAQGRMGASVSSICGYWNI